MVNTPLSLSTKGKTWLIKPVKAIKLTVATAGLAAFLAACDKTPPETGKDPSYMIGGQSKPERWGDMFRSGGATASNQVKARTNEVSDTVRTWGKETGTVVGRVTGKVAGFLLGTVPAATTSIGWSVGAGLGDAGGIVLGDLADIGEDIFDGINPFK